VVLYDSGGERPGFVAAGDLNGDGKPDLVVVNNESNDIAVLLGNGDGTFRAAVTYSVGGVNPGSVVIADVNGDGVPDLVVGNTCGSSTTCSTAGTVGVLLGNGDGTFQTPVSYPSGGSSPFQAVVADVNADGKPDVVVANESGLVAVLLGNGDGTFQAAVTYGSGGSAPGHVAVGDVNGDGKLDLVVANVCGSSCTSDLGTVGVLLGNGDGTFQAAVAYGSGQGDPVSVVLDDLTGNGNVDVVVANYCPLCSSGAVGVAVLLGNGNGTFQTVQTYASGGWAASQAVVADVNGDGIPDVLVANNSACNSCGFGDVGVLLGNGDGTFQTASTYVSGGFPASSIAVADVNGDGSPDLMLTNGCNLSCNQTTDGTVGVLLNTIQGFSKAPTSISLVSSVNPSVQGQLVKFAATVSWQGSGTPTGTVNFEDGTTIIGSVPLSGAGAALITSQLGAGTHSITAVYSGDSNFRASTSAVLYQTVNGAKNSTTVALSANPDPAAINTQVTYLAAINNGFGTAVTGTVTFTDSGKTVATVQVGVPNQASYTTSYSKSGSHSIAGTYSGDSNNNGSTSQTVVESITGSGALTSTTTSVTSTTNPSLIEQSVTFVASVSWAHGTVPDGETVTFLDGSTQIGTGTTASGIARFSASTLAAKTHTIKATYAGDSTFKTSSGTVRQLVELYTTAITLGSAPNPSNSGQAVTLTARVTTTGSSTPTGTVKFLRGTSSLGTGTLNSSGVATLTTTKLPVGADLLTAIYNGDSLNGKCTSSPITQTVN
jgi:hypothetical protein